MAIILAVYFKKRKSKEEVCYKTVEFKDSVKKTYTKYYFANNRLCGAVLIGDTSAIVKLTQDFKENKLFKDMF